MILGIEIGLTLLGLYTLIARKWPMGKKGFLVGREARILGILSVITLPVVTLIGFLIGIFFALAGKSAAIISSPWVSIGIEATVVASWVVLLMVLNARFGNTGRIIDKGESLP